MSVYTDCADAARKLLEDPSQRILSSKLPEGIFTELDVIMLAARSSPWKRGSKTTWMREAHHSVNGVMTYLFKGSQVVRYGPVEIPGLRPDYLRAATKVVYAAPDGPASIRTPNGVFRQITLKNDRYSHAGRRDGYNRDDFQPWSDQEISGRVFLLDTAQERRYASLMDENRTLHERVSELEAEVQRLRSHSAGAERRRSTKAR